MQKNIPSAPDLAAQIRRDIIRMVTRAKSGHPGGSLSSTDFMSVLYTEYLDQSPDTWTRNGKGIDLFFLSIGHVAPLLYSLLARLGYFPVAELGTLRKLGTRLQGHPCVECGLPGIHVASGSLGQGLSVACGAALAKRMDGDSHKVYVLVGDGESEEGQIWEAALFAGHHHLDNVIAMTDWNHQQIDGQVDQIGGIGDLRAKWESFGWWVIECDGHDYQAIRHAFAEALEPSPSHKPVMILMHTNMGQGVDFMCGTHKWHGKAPSEEQCAQALAQLPETLGDF